MKKETLIADDVKNNDDVKIMNKLDVLNNRLQYIKELKEKFGSNRHTELDNDEHK